MGCGLASLAVLPLGAQEAEREGEVVRRTDEGIVLNFQDMELRLVIGALADLAGMNVVLSDLPSRAVTLRTNRPVTPEEVEGYLRSVVQTYGLELEEENGLTLIEGGDTEQAPGGRELRTGGPDEPPATSGPPQLFVYRLRHAQAEDMAQTVSSIFGAGGGTVGRRQPGPRGLSAELRRQRDVPYMEEDRAEHPDAPQPPTDTPDAGQSGAPGTRLGASLEGEIRVVAEPFTNALLVRATPADWETIRSAVDELDARPLQVLIEVLIAEVRRDRRFGLGLGAEVPVDEESDELEVGGELAGLSAGDLAVRALNVGGLNASGVLRVLSSSSDVTILSRPVVLAQNNQEARILVGSQRPFIQLFRSLPTDAAIRDQVVQFRDVGTQLTIRPTINPDGYVALQVLQEVSSATAEVQFGAPVITTREAETQLLVRDGRTVVLGGLVDRQQQVSKSGVPILKDIPLLGGLFGSTNRSSVHTELFLFLTPHVLRSDEEVEDMTERVRDVGPELSRELDGRIPLLHGDTVAPAGDTTWNGSGAGPRR